MAEAQPVGVGLGHILVLYSYIYIVPFLPAFLFHPPHPHCIHYSKLISKYVRKISDLYHQHYSTSGVSAGTRLQRFCTWILEGYSHIPGPRANWKKAITCMEREKQGKSGSVVVREAVLLVGRKQKNWELTFGGGSLPGFETSFHGVGSTQTGAE